MAVEKALRMIALALCAAMVVIFSASCAGSADNAGETVPDSRKAFMKLAPDEISSLSEFDLLCSERYFVQVKITYLMNDMRMKISRDGDKYDVFTETIRTYSHNIIKDGLDYKLDDEKKTYSVSEATEKVNVSFFNFDGSFVYKGVTQGEFNEQKAFLYKFDVTDEKGAKSTLTFAVKDKKLLGTLSDQTGYETKLTFESISKEPADGAFSVPSDYKETK